jgi:hypothetical protein
MIADWGGVPFLAFWVSSWFGFGFGFYYRMKNNIDTLYLIENNPVFFVGRRHGTVVQFISSQRKLPRCS